MNLFNKLCLGLLGLAFLTACSDEREHRNVHQSGFVFCGQSDPETFNPQLVDSGVTAETLGSQLYDTLLTIDPISFQPRASIATEWQSNHAGTEYLLTLRDDVKFQTTPWFTPTRPLNASDVVFSFERIINKAAPYHNIGGGLYPWFSRINFATFVQNVEAINDRQVKFTLTRPNFAFLSTLATPHSAILSSEYAQYLRQNDQMAQLDKLPVGSGPFLLVEHKANDYIRLKRHVDHWRGKAVMKQMVLDVSQRGTGTLAKLMREECDVLSTPLASQLHAIQRHPNLLLSAVPAMNVAFVAINTRHPALADVRVRQALSFAINRQRLLESVYYGAGIAATTLLPPNSWAYQKDQRQVHYDREHAIALLDEAGYGDGLALSMWVPLTPRAYNPSPHKAAELIQANLADIGIRLTLFTDDRAERKDLQHTQEADLFLTGWIADTGEPDSILRPLLSCSSQHAGLNVSMWCNDDFDFLLDLALETKEQRYRVNLYYQVQNLLNQEFPVIPLAHGMQQQVHHRSLIGIKSSPFHALPFHNVERLY
ncbi:ABC transporter substrate-binding protein [Vibrio sp. SM6]|uniref:ABC transporter substrate-binding protein n=1 Tax=Vibrio agarilyticus TaxID=2726741 RepID=A0A7X8TMR4_9VIBR|nr:ABC transporter substrate-binding protein [Vibrio agarilyticus]NLS11414.1 ABC transporter substrate-binding protein [Vibrio agarilyticus]